MRAETPSGPVFSVHMKVNVSEKEVLINDLRFDGRVGFNITSDVAKEGNGRTPIWTHWEYAEYDGVFVPKAIIRVVAHEDGQHLAFQRNLELQTCKVNGPLHPDGFSYKRLGLKDGERVVDRIENKLYLLDKDQLVAAEQYEPLKQQAPGSNRWKIILGLNIVILLAIFAYWLIRGRVRNA